jgi:hypothetical protein
MVVTLSPSAWGASFCEDGARPPCELRGNRTEFSKTFLGSDGVTRTTHISSGPMHWQDESQNWRDFVFQYKRQTDGSDLADEATWWAG